MVALVLGAAVLASISAMAASRAGAGFYVDTVHAGFADFQLTDLAHVDETHVLATGKSGAVRWVPLDDPTAGREIVRLSVHDDTDLGLVSLALANDYATSGRVYLSSNHRDRIGAFGRLSAWTVDDPAAPTSMARSAVLLDRIRTDAPIHSVGEIVVRSDETLYLAVGDGWPNSGGASTETLRTYDPDAPQGKVLRVGPDGRGVPGNPFYDADAPDAWRSRVWAVGLRNPFRFTTLPGDEDVLVIGNVGRNGDESLFVGGPGANFGWPCMQGREPTVGYADLEECQDLLAQDPSPFTPPTWAYDRSLPPGGGVSITGGVFPMSTSYPASFRDDYLFGDYARSLVWSAELDADGDLVRVPEAGEDGTGSGVFARDLGAPVSFVTSPSGVVRWADILTGEIVTLRWTSGNRLLMARASAALDETTTVRFGGAGSYDLDGDDLTHTRDFGDRSAVADRPALAHTYASSDAFVATRTVTDGAGGSDQVEVLLRLGDAPPTVTALTTPGD